MDRPTTSDGSDSPGLGVLLQRYRAIETAAKEYPIGSKVIGGILLALIFGLTTYIITNATLAIQIAGPAAILLLTTLAAVKSRCSPPSEDRLDGDIHFALAATVVMFVLGFIPMVAITFLDVDADQKALLRHLERVEKLVGVEVPKEERAQLTEHNFMRREAHYAMTAMFAIAGAVWNSIASDLTRRRRALHSEMQRQMAQESELFLERVQHLESVIIPAAPEGE